jgi:aryl-alcohol dehydrogenase-like predicted oxidoreductase
VGGNFLDTANRYADGRSEELVGELLAGRRERIVLATKYTGAANDRDPNSSGSHRKSLVQALEGSLRRLKTDYVDLLWVHSWDTVTPIDELMRALDDQVRVGKVLHVGISNAPGWMIGTANAVASLRGWSGFVAVQNEYNLLERGAERELLPMCRFFGLGFLAWAPIAQGRLTGKYSVPTKEPKRLLPHEVDLSTRKETIIAETVSVAQELGCAPSTVALRWNLQRQPEAIPILGVRTIGQLEASLACLEIDVSPEQMSRLEAVSAIDPGSPTGFMRSEGGRDFMWGDPRTVPAPLSPNHSAWWER